MMKCFAVPLPETTRMRVGRVVAPIYTLPGRALRVLDVAQHREPSARDESPIPERPPQLLVTIAHWRASPDSVGPLDSTRLSVGAERLHHLLECLRSVLEVDAERTTVAIATNEPQSVA